MIDLRTGMARLRVVALYLVAVTLVGTLGYMWLEGWSWNDAFYMTAITLTAVGYQEVHPLTEAGRYWSMGLLAGGITGLGMWFALVTAFLVEMDLGKSYTRRKTMKEIRRMRGHTIVCGGGRMGAGTARALASYEQAFVVVERDEERASRIREDMPDAIVLVGDATEDRVLRKAGLERASGLVACLSDDTDNLFVSLSAHHLRPELAIVARAEDETATDKMLRAGATHVVSPNAAAALRVATMLTRPAVATFFEQLAALEVEHRIEQVTVGAAFDGSGKGRRLDEMGVSDQTGLAVIALRKEGDGAGGPEVIVNPGPSERVRAGDHLVVLGTPRQVERLRERAGE